MSKFMLEDEDAINDVNPFVKHDFSLPGGVRQSGDFSDFSETREESGIPTTSKSVFCDYALCTKGASCSLSREVHPRRNIDPGFTQENKSLVRAVKVGVSNNPEMSIIGASIILGTILIIAYYSRR